MVNDTGHRQFVREGFHYFMPLSAYVYGALITREVLSQELGDIMWNIYFVFYLEIFEMCH
jgi:hypothetical protein